MIYLPHNASDCVLMEGNNPDGSKKLWIAAYAFDGGQRDVTFTCWQGHENVPDAVWQGKTLARGNNAKQRFRTKIEEKELKGYRILASLNRLNQWVPDTLPNLPLPAPASNRTGNHAGSMMMQKNQQVLTLHLIDSPQGYRLDQREWTGLPHNQPSFPDWQTLYSNSHAALAAIESVRSNRESRGLTVQIDSIPWNIRDVPLTNLITQEWVMPGNGLVWDF